MGKIGPIFKRCAKKQLQIINLLLPNDDFMKKSG